MKHSPKRVIHSHVAPEISINPYSSFVRLKENVGSVVKAIAIKKSYRIILKLAFYNKLDISPILAFNPIRSKPVLRNGWTNAVANTRIFPPNSILSSERDNYVTVSSSVIHELENTRQFSFFIVRHVLENQSRGDRKIAVRTDGTSFCSDVKKEKERR